MTVFVYGTLKKGFENHHFLNGAKFIGNATTKEKYPMVNIVKAYPYLINKRDIGHHVKGELYKIDEKTLKQLDYLEGYPEHYTRHSIEIICNSQEVLAIVYFLNKQIQLLNCDFLEEFLIDEYMEDCQ